MAHAESAASEAEGGVTKSDTWMPLYIGDYLADTMHLSGAEHGAYLLLIIHYWRTGPLPDDDRKLAAIARTGKKEWGAGIGETVRAFFHLEEGQLHHKRIDTELATAERMTAQRSAAGKASVAAKSLKREAKREANERSTPVEVSFDFRATPSPSPSQEERKKEPPKKSKEPPPTTARHAGPLQPLASLAVRAQDSAEFQQFWQKYPRREGKGAARQAFAKARKSASFEAIVAALDRPWPNDPRFVPHPATWLNQQRWLDEPSTLLGARPETRVNPPFRNGFAALGARLAEQAAAVPKPVENRRLLEEKRDETTA